MNRRYLTSSLMLPILFLLHQCTPNDTKEQKSNNIKETKNASSEDRAIPAQSLRSRNDVPGGKETTARSLFLLGRTKEQEGNHKDAALYYQQAADRGDVEAQFDLGMMYKEGRGVPRDERVAAMWFKKAARQGLVRAQVVLGEMYSEGVGVLKNDMEAVRWFRMAAKKGNASAQFNLGMSYANGEGVRKNERKAVLWYRKAAEQGYAAAQVGLAIMYWGGRGVPEDIVKAYMWANLAAASGYDIGKELRDKLEEEMARNQIEKAQAMSREWLQRHAADNRRDHPDESP